MKIITDAHCTEYSRPGHPERPQRIIKTVEKLRQQTDLAIDWAEPLTVSDKTLLRAHSAEHLARVKNAPSDFDADPPSYAHIFDHALRSVGGALHALKVARAGQVSFSLLRPP